MTFLKVEFSNSKIQNIISELIFNSGGAKNKQKKILGPKKIFLLNILKISKKKEISINFQGAELRISQKKFGPKKIFFLNNTQLKTSKKKKDRKIKLKLILSFFFDVDIFSNFSCLLLPRPATSTIKASSTADF